MGRKKLKFLSKSVLLEEAGLTNVNRNIIMTIFTSLLLFLILSNYIILDESIEVSGYVSFEERNDIKFIAHVPSANISKVKRGYKSLVEIPGVTNREKLISEVVRVDVQPHENSSGRVYYKVNLKNDFDEATNNDLRDVLLNGMELNAQIVVENKSLLRYLLGPLWITGESR